MLTFLVLFQLCIVLASLVLEWVESVWVAMDFPITFLY